jgi:hypothetical protein
MSWNRSPRCFRIPEVGCAVFFFVRVLTKYTSPIENWLEFFNQLWGKGLEHFQGQYVQSQTGGNGAFRIMKVHRAFNLGLRGLLVRDEWDITWDWAGKEYVGGISNFIIVGQTGIGVHYFLHVFLLLSLTLRIREDSLSLLLSWTALGPRSHNVLSKHS